MLDGFFLRGSLRVNSQRLWLTATHFTFPSKPRAAFGHAGAPSENRVVTLVELRRSSKDASCSSCADSGGGAEPGGTNLTGSLTMTPAPSR